MEVGNADTVYGKVISPPDFYPLDECPLCHRVVKEIDGVMEPHLWPRNDEIDQERWGDYMMNQGKKKRGRKSKNKSVGLKKQWCLASGYDRSSVIRMIEFGF